MNILLYILAMAGTTYLLRAIPLTLMKKECSSRFLRSFLHYIPTACLTAMTFPAILYATDHLLSGAAGLLVGILLAYKKRSLITVALASCVTVFIVDQLMLLL